jgi:peroxiredoxin
MVQYVGVDAGAAGYNYDHYSFVLETAEGERWVAQAPALGEVGPDFELSDVTGRSYRLSDLRERPVVIEFGSYTCPIFCAQIPAMEALARQHPDAAFLVIYTREAHPGEVTPAHRTRAEKLAAATRLLAEEDVARTVLVDDVEGTVHAAYGGAWDTVFVLDPESRVVLRRAWNDPQQVDAILSAFEHGEQPEALESSDMTATAGRGGFGHGLLRGGKQALLDFYDSAPPPVKERLRSSESQDVRNIVA